MDEKYKSLLIQELEQELTNISNISTGTIASKIEDIGFSCLMCGKCCRHAFGDNRVLLMPNEIQLIANHTTLEAHEIATPATSDVPDSDLIDTDGKIHTFGWMLARKSNGDCNFIEDAETSNKCKIHDVRPMLCRTYPFYMQDMELHVSECEGLGRKITSEESITIANDVITRYVAEIEDTIALYKKFEDFTTGKDELKITSGNVDEKYHVVYVVHDSKGTHEITR
ncbi:MAG: YkgJ family cysteine cluster protein [Methanosarcinaceae archaeon]|nr:YkgJ family cysteine cluster protein [Methanosarcinaceae archaeon]